jgi:hypothetical protein
MNTGAYLLAQATCAASFLIYRMDVIAMITMSKDRGLCSQTLSTKE